MIILTMLGAGDYEDVVYSWNGRQSQLSKFSAASLLTWFPDAQVKVLETDEAREKNRKDYWHAIPSAEPISIPAGKSDGELWEIYNTIVEILPEGEEVVLDITHGFRSLSTIVLLALAFLRTAKNIRVKHVLYGARDARENQASPVPIFDLTPFVRMLDWANATDLFIKTGDARGISPLLQENQKSPLNGVAGGLTALSDAIFCMRAKEIQEEAQRLTRLISQSMTEEWSPHQSPLKLLLEHIEQNTRQIRAPNTLRAQLEQICWLQEHRHYPAAASLAREWLISLRIVLHGGNVFPVVRDQRVEAEGWLGLEMQKIRNGEAIEAPIWKPAVEVFGSVSDLRNDLMHFGMRSQPLKPSKIKLAVDKLPAKLREAATSLGVELGPDEL